jgi:hypothetical protein
MGLLFRGIGHGRAWAGLGTTGATIVGGAGSGALGGAAGAAVTGGSVVGGAVGGAFAGAIDGPMGASASGGEGASNLVVFLTDLNIQIWSQVFASR